MGTLLCPHEIPRTSWKYFKREFEGGGVGGDPIYPRDCSTTTKKQSVKAYMRGTGGGSAGNSREMGTEKCA